MTVFIDTFKVMSGIVKIVESISPSVHEEQHSQNMQNLLDSGKHSDIVFAVGDSQFPVHKNILSARSPVFSAMFDHEDTKEAQERVVDIIDVPKEVFQELLKYIYTGKVPDKNLLTEDLLAASDKVRFFEFYGKAHFAHLTKHCKRQRKWQALL